MTNNERQIKNLEAQLVPILKNIELAYAKAKEILPQDVYDETVRITGLIMPPPQAIDGSYEEYTSSEEYKIYISTEYQNDVKNLTKKLEAISGTTAIMGEVAGNIASKKSILWQIKYLQEKYLEKEYRRIKKLYEAKKQEIIDDLGEFIEEGKRLNKEIADLAIAIKTDYDTRKEAAKVSYEIGSREYDVTDRVETDKRSRLLAEQNATYQFMFDAVADNIARSYGYPNYKQVPNGWINGNSPHELCHQEVLNWSLTNVVYVGLRNKAKIQEDIIHQSYKNTMTVLKAEVDRRYQAYLNITNSPTLVAQHSAKQTELNNLTADKTLIAQQDALKLEANNIAKSFNKSIPAKSNNLYVSDTGLYNTFSKIAENIAKPYAFENTSTTDKYYAVTSVNNYGESGLSNVVKVLGKKPFSVTIQPRGNILRIFWDNLGDTVATYKVEYGERIVENIPSNASHYDTTPFKTDILTPATYLIKVTATFKNSTTRVAQIYRDIIVVVSTKVEKTITINNYLKTQLSVITPSGGGGASGFGASGGGGSSGGSPSGGGYFIINNINYTTYTSGGQGGDGQELGMPNYTMGGGGGGGSYGTGQNAVDIGFGGAGDGGYKGTITTHANLIFDSIVYGGGGGIAEYEEEFNGGDGGYGALYRSPLLNADPQGTVFKVNNGAGGNGGSGTYSEDGGSGADGCVMIIIERNS